MHQANLDLINYFVFCYFQIDLNNSKQVWQFFSSQHLTQTQMSNGLQILLYDVNLLKQAWNKLQESETFEEWKNDQNLLVYLVYLIEKDHQMDGKAALIGKTFSNETDTLAKRC
jgi:hypothetical protein